MILEARPTVIPVCIDGMNRLLPIGSVFPRLFRKIYIYYGEPIDLSDYYEKEKTKEVATEIMNRVMDRIRAMHAEIEQMKSSSKAYTAKVALPQEKIHRFFLRIILKFRNFSFRNFL